MSWDGNDYTWLFSIESSTGVDIYNYFKPGSMSGVSFITNYFIDKTIPMKYP